MTDEVTGDRCDGYDLKRTAVRLMVTDKSQSPLTGQYFRSGRWSAGEAAGGAGWRSGGEGGGRERWRSAGEAAAARSASPKFVEVGSGGRRRRLAVRRRGRWPRTPAVDGQSTGEAAATGSASPKFVEVGSGGRRWRLTVRRRGRWPRTSAVARSASSKLVEAGSSDRLLGDGGRRRQPRAPGGRRRAKEMATRSWEGGGRPRQPVVVGGSDGRWRVDGATADGEWVEARRREKREERRKREDREEEERREEEIRPVGGWWAS
uniref:Uncharacterized protein n=1 Tax=Oryza meridionalis TaxID=40149 RepID=A0A0E0EXX6_9ORYZ